jgi:hypothetical protein
MRSVSSWAEGEDWKGRRNERGSDLERGELLLGRHELFLVWEPRFLRRGFALLRIQIPLVVLCLDILALAPER